MLTIRASPRCKRNIGLIFNTYIQYMTFHSKTEIFSFTPTTNKLAPGNGCSGQGGLFKKSVSMTQNMLKFKQCVQMQCRPTCLFVCLLSVWNKLGLKQGLRLQIYLPADQKATRLVQTLEQERCSSIRPPNSSTTEPQASTFGGFV